MNYLIVCRGNPTPLDKEHIVNRMFDVAKYAKRAYFLDEASGINKFAYIQALKWVEYNDGFNAELIKFKLEDIDIIKKDIIDILMIFADDSTFNSSEYLSEESYALSRGSKIEKYALGTWDKKEDA